MPNLILWMLASTSFLFPATVWASGEVAQSIAPVSGWVGPFALVLFAIAYVLVVLEDYLHLRKSIPVLMAAGLIWTLIGMQFGGANQEALVEEALRHSFLEFAELFFFLLVAMTFINTLEDRGIFAQLQSTLLQRGFSLRTIFWLTGLLSFLLSPIADNMTTALVMASVAMAVGVGQPKFVLLACINIVVAANAGGAFSPFGDITTLMVWQKGLLHAQDFLHLLLPSIINWLIPAFILSRAIGNLQPQPVDQQVVVHPGGVVVIFMFIATIALTVILHTWLHFPPVLGMMGGLGMLKLYSYLMDRMGQRSLENAELMTEGGLATGQAAAPLNTFHQVARAEWDTLLFFYGIILCVGGLGMLGYLSMLSELIYNDLGSTTANVLVGFMSAIVDNIPVMYAVLTMNPDMSMGQWLLVTLTAGVGGSMLSIGSAAGVAVMGQAQGIYTFMGHLRWAWAIGLGYAASIVVHFWINKHFFAMPIIGH